MLHFCILLLLGIGWRIALDMRAKAVHEQKVARQQKQKSYSDSDDDPEFFVWKLSNPES